MRILQRAEEGKCRLLIDLLHCATSTRTCCPHLLSSLAVLLSHCHPLSAKMPCHCCAMTCIPSLTTAAGPRNVANMQDSLAAIAGPRNVTNMQQSPQLPISAWLRSDIDQLTRSMRYFSIVAESPEGRAGTRRWRSQVAWLRR